MYTRLLIAVALVLAALSAGIAHLINVGGDSYAGGLQALSTEETATAVHLRSNLEFFTLQLGARSLNRGGTLARAAEEIETRLRSLRYDPQSQGFTAMGRKVRNLIVDVPSTSVSSSVILIGTHYDSYRGSPGANANGSGVVALLELARLMKDKPLPFKLRFAFLVNGEAPYYGTQDSGAVNYAQHVTREGDRIRFALLLDSIGYFSTEPGSQDFPFPTRLGYPDVGDFLTAFGSPGQREAVGKFTQLWNRHCQFPLKGGSLPFWFPGVPLGDHAAFDSQGIPALLLSDTGTYRYEGSGSPYDMHTRLDYGRMARIVHCLVKILPGLDQVGS